MPRGIVSQSVQYGLPEKEARTLPPAAEVSDLLTGHGIVPGMMSRRTAVKWYQHNQTNDVVSDHDLEHKFQDARFNDPALSDYANHGDWMQNELQNYRRIQ
jgi:hypothetical protein